MLNENQDAAHDYFTKLCQLYDVEYYDFNYAKIEYLPRSKEDFIDAEGHHKEKLATRQTELLMKIEKSSNKQQYFEKDYKSVLAGLGDDDLNNEAEATQCKPRAKKTENSEANNNIQVKV